MAAARAKVRSAHQTRQRARIFFGKESSLSASALPVCNFRLLATLVSEVRWRTPDWQTQALNPIRKILEASSQSGGGVSSELLPLVYDELRALAARRLARESGGQTLQPTALVHEVWLSVSGNDQICWNDRAHFFRTAALAMRRILVQRARAKATVKRGERKVMLNIDDFDFAETSLDERVLLVDEMMDRLEQEDPESARVISLKFFGGLTNKEIATMEGVTERTIERQWAYAKARLLQMYLEAE
jgi:RNA polymerase sigma factor (TIGR02999 family)